MYVCMYVCIHVPVLKIVEYVVEMCCLYRTVRENVRGILVGTQGGPSLSLYFPF